MTATAEALPLSSIEPGFTQPWEVVAGSASVEWRDADTIGALRHARNEARATAQQILDERIQLVCDNPETAEVPNPVDPLTTAGRVLAAEQRFGADSSEYAEAHSGLVHDCARLMAEAYRKRRWEYFPELRQTYDPATGEYEFMGYSLQTMVTQGITPLAERDEQANRAAEFVEEQTYRTVRGLGHVAVGNVAVLRPGQPKPVAESGCLAAPEVRVMTVSECPDWAIAAYGRQSKSGWGGYAPEAKKLMIRGVRFANDGDRYQEQLALPGEYITHEVVVEALQNMQVVAPDENPSKEVVRSKQLLNVNGQDVFAVAERLDHIASRRSGKRIYLGEVVSENDPRDYQAARLEAAERQERQQQQAEELADFLMGLERNGADHWVAQGMVERRVHKMVFSGVKGDAEAAAAAFNDETAVKVAEATRERAAGNEARALQIETIAEREAPPVGFCGAGSCGIEEAGDGDEADAMREKLGTTDDEELVRDTERPCRDCGKKSIWYSYNTSTLKKGCSSCGATEFRN